ncbi:hypothetical protein UNDYM_3334 [Undibacterium sp. YM2]|jgi:hypothetical protein|nr:MULTISPECIES: hypothetical protein [unclassified Undibacterium]BBB67587.1 hypothetical protein UNDYM_3334 [Undibacterium sp. YM2]
MTEVTPPSKTQAEKDSGSPKFGRLLLVLIFAVMLIVVITLGSEAYYTN